MTEPEPTYTTDPPTDDRITAQLLALRADLTGTIVQIERALEASGRPVESVIVTRRQRRNLTRATKKRNM